MLADSEKHNKKNMHLVHVFCFVFFYPVLQSFLCGGALMQSDKLLSGLIQATGRARQN